jgi:transposase-like protein
MQAKQANKTTQFTATKRTMRRYSDEFKRELVHYAHSHPDKRLIDLAIEFDVPMGTFSKWIGLYGKAQSPADMPSAKEIKRLERELSIAKQEVALLKKFNVYLARAQKTSNKGSKL